MIDQIFNAYESLINVYNHRRNYKSLPDRSLLLTADERANNTASNTKTLKNRITFLACSNVSGSYSLPLCFIHKVANPRCYQIGGKDKTTKKLKSLDKKELPVDKVQSDSWMSSQIIEDFDPRV